MTSNLPRHIFFVTVLSFDMQHVYIQVIFIFLIFEVDKWMYNSENIGQNRGS